MENGEEFEANKRVADKVGADTRQMRIRAYELFGEDILMPVKRKSLYERIDRSGEESPAAPEGDPGCPAPIYPRRIIRQKGDKGKSSD